MKEKMTVMLDREALLMAQMEATRRGMAPKDAGNTSAFLRWLVQDYIDRGNK